MKRPLILALAASAMLLGAGAAQANHVNWSIGINLPPVGTVISSGPAYYAPEPVYFYPAPTYYAPPVVYREPAPVYYGSRVWEHPVRDWHGDWHGDGRGDWHSMPDRDRGHDRRWVPPAPRDDRRYHQDDRAGYRY